MKPLTRILSAIALTGFLVLDGLSGAQAADRETLFQYSTIDGLLAGLYDGELTVGDIPSKGDFGLGTFNGLDDEMIVVDGTVFQARAGGAVTVASAATRVPFTSVTFFDADQTAPLLEGLNLEDLEALLDALAPNPNIFHGIRIDGQFALVKLRVAPKQNKPYAPLAQVIEQQEVFELRNVAGTLVGIRAPGYLSGLNVPGYHFHFLTGDRLRGGHVFGVVTTRGTIQVDNTAQFTVALPQSLQFAGLDLDKQREEELRKVEKAQAAPAHVPSLAAAPPMIAVPTAPTFAPVPVYVAPQPQPIPQPQPAAIAPQPVAVAPAQVVTQAPAPEKKRKAPWSFLFECRDEDEAGVTGARRPAHKADHCD